MTASIDSLIHLTDLHFWQVVGNPLLLLNKRFLGNANVIYRRRHEFHMENSIAYTDHVASLGINNVLIGGDFTSTATPREFQRGKAFVDGLVDKGLQVDLMPGNHDVYTFESLRTGRFSAYFGAFESPEGYPCRKTLPGGTPLLLVPTVCPNYLSSAGNISEEEAEQTRALLDACPAGPVIVAGHYPILHRTQHYSSGKSRQLRHAARLRAALGESGRQILYVAGHVHRFSYTEDSYYPNVHHLTSNAFFLQRPGEAVRGAFSVIHIDAAGFRVEWHEKRDHWEILHPECLPEPSV